MPSEAANITDKRPTTSEMREPYRMVENMSRPWSSVPSRPPAGAPLSFGSVPASIRRSSGARIDTDARVDRGVQEVDDEVDRHEDRGDEQQVGGEYRDIGVLHRLEEQQAHAGPLKHG